jgi:hypothetical protein
VPQDPRVMSNNTLVLIWRRHPNSNKVRKYNAREDSMTQSTSSLTKKIAIVPTSVWAQILWTSTKKTPVVRIRTIPQLQCIIMSMINQLSFPNHKTQQTCVTSFSIKATTRTQINYRYIQLPTKIINKAITTAIQSWRTKILSTPHICTKRLHYRQLLARRHLRTRMILSMC